MRLYTRGVVARPFPSSTIARVTVEPISERERRSDYALVPANGDRAAIVADYEGYAAVLLREDVPGVPAAVPTVVGAPHLDDLRTGDVVGIDPTGDIRFLYRKSSAYNSILVTERCNSRCLMCSQPPRERDDSWRLREHLRLIEHIDPETKELGITGGEPTLLGDGLLQLVEHCKRYLPRTALHILTNGRLFYYSSFPRHLAAVRHPDLMLGIPVYSDLDSEHDFIVQAKGAFEETIVGLLNLARYRVPVEIRVVLHALTYARLPELAEFIYRNLPFAAHVAFMGMEMVGYVHKHLDRLWVDPFQYRHELERSTLYLASRGMNVSIYNLQLCILPRTLWPLARKSISDWKNIYLAECDACHARAGCGGFFQSAAKKHSQHIRALQEPLDWQHQEAPLLSSA